MTSDEEKPELNYGWKKGYFIYKSGESKLDIPKGIYNCKFTFKGKKAVTDPLKTFDRLKKYGFERTFPNETKNHQVGKDYLLSYLKEPTTITISLNKKTNHHDINLNFSEPIQNIEEIEEYNSLLEKIVRRKVECVTPLSGKLIKKIDKN